MILLKDYLGDLMRNFLLEKSGEMILRGTTGVSCVGKECVNIKYFREFCILKLYFLTNGTLVLDLLQDPGL